MTDPRLEPADLARAFLQLPTPYLVMTPDLVIVEANDTYLATVSRTREELVGLPVFKAFPPTVDALTPEGVPRVQVSFERARDTGRPDRMPLQKYDIADPDGGLSERYWSLTSVPVLGDDGETMLVVQRAEDVTDYVLGRLGQGLAEELVSSSAGGDHLGRTGTAWGDPAEGASTGDTSAREAVAGDVVAGDASAGDELTAAGLRRRTQELEADLFARAQDLAAAMEAKELSARRVGHLAALALQLRGVDTVADLAEVLTREQVAVLGAHAAAVLLPAPDGGWQVPLSTATESATTAPWQQIPADSTLPAPTVARTGHRVLLLTRETAAQRFPGMAAVNEATGMAAWAFLPLRSRTELLGSLVIGWRDEQDLSADELELLEGFAAQLSQTIARIRATEAEAAASAEVHRLSETVQRSLLQNPPVPDALRVAVRYVPAAEHVRVGGDWYDAFVTTGGATLLTIGDVTGHDGTAAATMAQIRSLLRGLAYDSPDGPATVLARLDRALEGLRLDTLATAVVVRVETPPGGDGGATDGRWLRWSNAGHLAPVLRHPDGRVEVLDGEHDLLLGLDPATPRADRLVVAPPGSTMVLHTDGLIERRTVSLQAGVDRLCQVLAEHGDLPPEELADRVLAEVAPESNEDDIALVVLQVA